MGRSYLVVVTLVAGCNFEHSVGDRVIDAAGHDAIAIDAAVDAPAGGPACGGKTWHADFATDPTATPDWAMRVAPAFDPSQLANGIWLAPVGAHPLDSQPRQTFATRTIAHARMRGTTAGSARGAVFWINVGYDANHGFVPLFVDAKLKNDGKENVSLWTKKASDASEKKLADTDLPDGGMVDISLDIDPVQLVVLFSIGSGPATSYLLERLPTGPDPGDGWGTVVPYAGTAEFDDVSIEVCP